MQALCTSESRSNIRMRTNTHKHTVHVHLAKTLLSLQASGSGSAADSQSEDDLLPNRVVWSFSVGAESERERSTQHVRSLGDAEHGLKAKTLRQCVEKKDKVFERCLSASHGSLDVYVSVLFIATIQIKRDDPFARLDFSNGSLEVQLIALFI